MCATAFFLASMIPKVRGAALVVIGLVIPCATLALLTGVWDIIAYVWWEKKFVPGKSPILIASAASFSPVLATRMPPACHPHAAHRPPTCRPHATSNEARLPPACRHLACRPHAARMPPRMPPACHPHAAHRPPICRPHAARLPPRMTLSTRIARLSGHPARLSWHTGLEVFLAILLPPFNLIKILTDANGMAKSVFKYNETSGKMDRVRPIIEPRTMPAA